jgi:hypothetical protein
MPICMLGCVVCQVAVEVIGMVDRGPAVTGWVCSARLMRIDGSSVIRHSKDACDLLPFSACISTWDDFGRVGVAHGNASYTHAPQRPLGLVVKYS